MCPTTYLITFAVAIVAKTVAVLLALLIIWLMGKRRK